MARLEISVANNLTELGHFCLLAKSSINSQAINNSAREGAQNYCPIVKSLFAVEIVTVKPMTTSIKEVIVNIRKVAFPN